MLVIFFIEGVTVLLSLPLLTLASHSPFTTHPSPEPEP